MSSEYQNVKSNKMATKFSALLSFVLITTLVSLSREEVEQAMEKPHIVFMLVDDWGWANVGYHRKPPTPEVVTPNIDNLVKDGLELDQHYAFQFCSPSRSSFISGRLPIHVNDLNLHLDIYSPNDPISGFAGIPRNTTGIATKLKAASTPHIRWESGMQEEPHLTTHQLEE